MTSKFKNTIVNGTGYLHPVSRPTSARANTITTIIQWTNTGSQSSSVLAGNTPTLTTTSWTAPTGVTSVEVLVVAGGGGGGAPAGSTPYTGGGGGAGGLIYNNAFTVTPGTAYTVTVGTGGSGASSSGGIGGNGNNSVFGSLTAIGGGGGGGLNANSGSTGGSGGGGSSPTVPFNAGSAGTAGQGNAGGRGFQGGNSGGGGGGGAATAGGDGSNGVAGGAGLGLNFNISGTATWYAGGGGASTEQSSYYSMGGIGGGGAGGQGNGTAGTASTGGGGGGATRGVYSGGAGGSGVVVIRYTVLNDENTLADGSIHYNTDIRELEVYNRAASGWTAQDPTVNFGGHNLIAYSDNIDLATSTWTYGEVTTSLNSTRAPDGTLTADLVIATALSSTIHRIRNAGPGGLTSTEYYTLSVYAKAAGYNWIKVRQGSNATNFNLSTGTIGSPWNGYGTTPTSTITNVGNGWYRLSVTAQCNATTDPSFIYIDSGDSATADTVSWTGDGSSGIYVWGMQLERSTTAGPYVRTAGVVSPVPTVLNGYRTHTYTTVGTSGFTATTSGTVEVLVVGGGGGGANATGSNWGAGGGGGAGGLIYNMSYPVVAGQAYTVTVGAGGAGGVQGVSGSGGNGANGGNSSFGRLTAIGGGGGGSAQEIGLSGGSGGGSGYNNLLPGAGTFGQGNTGGRSQVTPSSGGGGGAGGAGADGNTNIPGYGGNGRQINISGVPTYYAGGGGGGYYNANLSAATGGLGGGGAGGTPSTSVSNAGSAAVANTGGGGGGGSANSANGIGSAGAGGAGGSGIVIVRYRYS